MPFRFRKVLLLGVLALAVGAFFALGGPRYVTLETLKAQHEALRTVHAQRPVATAAAYALLYVAATGLSLPGAATLLTLAGGALFGLLWGTVIVSFASSIGATLAFLASRFVLREWVRERFGAVLARIDAGVKRDGAFYLFTLRLIPLVPFFVVNLALGLTAIRTRTFYWVSQLGMLAGTIVYVNAGTQLARVSSTQDILSPSLLGAFALLGIFPLMAKKAIDGISARRVYGPWTKPRAFDRNLVVIGAGSAGLVAAYIGATVRAKVTLVEKHRMGGDCLNTGCVPSKALIRTARLAAQIRDAERFGLKEASARVDFARVMERVQQVIRDIEPHDSIERYTRLGVECLEGEARITSPWTVEVKTAQGVRELSTRAIVVAAGARPFVPPIEGMDRIDVLTSDNVWALRELPRRLLVLGGGPIGCELAQAFARLGARVTQVEMLPRLLAREDPEASERVQARFVEEGVDVRLSHKALRVEAGVEAALVCEHEGQEVRIAFDRLLCAMGRAPNTNGYGLETLGIALAPDGALQVNEYLQARFPNIYACGDVTGPYQFTHVASHQAWYAAVNALFGGLRRFRVDYSVIPWTTFTDPEVARVGLSETEARARGVAHEVTTYDLAELDRAIADGAARGLVKVLTVPGKDRILGAAIVGDHAGELIGEFVSAMKHGLGLNKILGTIHVYPTWLEANKYAAGAWKRAHAPEALLRRLERFHAWRRGRP